jgi:hypothetical protein
MMYEEESAVTTWKPVIISLVIGFLKFVNSITISEFHAAAASYEIEKMPEF